MPQTKPMNTAYVFQRYYDDGQGPYTSFHGMTFGGLIVIAKNEADAIKFSGARQADFRVPGMGLFTQNFVLQGSFPTSAKRQIIKIEGYGLVEKGPRMRRKANASN